MKFICPCPHTTFYWNTATCLCFRMVCAFFRLTVAEPSGQDRGYVACRAKENHCLALHRKSVQTCDLGPPSSRKNVRPFQITCVRYDKRKYKSHGEQQNRYENRDKQEANKKRASMTQLVMCFLQSSRKPVQKGQFHSLVFTRCKLITLSQRSPISSQEFTSRVFRGCSVMKQVKATAISSQQRQK